MSGASKPTAGGARRVEHVWGTVISLDVRDEVGLELIDDVFAWFGRVDDLFSTWRDDSEISRLARRELSLRDVADEVRTVLAICDEITAESRGAFDITFASDPRVPTRPGFAPIDPSGVVKGWALERAGAMLSGVGIRNFSINAGGDLLTRGRPEPGREWRIGIQHPIERQAVAAVVAGTNLAVATSGRYERGDHIIDPRTGAPATGLLSVTVTGSDLAFADGYATAVHVLGDEGMDWLAAIPGVEGMAITNDDTVVRTDGFPDASSAPP